MRLWVDVRCPLCGCMGRKELETNVRPSVVLCDSEDGGCDDWFVATVEVVAVHTVKTGVIGQMREVTQ